MNSHDPVRRGQPMLQGIREGRALGSGVCPITTRRRAFDAANVSGAQEDRRRTEDVDFVYVYEF